MALRGADGRVALAWRVVPIAFGLFLAINVGALFLLGHLGGRPAGTRLSIRFTTSCGTQALPVLQARAERIGLGTPEWTTDPQGIGLVATMPGLDDDATAIPALLARRGLLEVRHGDTVLATQADLTKPTLELDPAGMPYDQLTFQPEVGEALTQAVAGDPKGELVFVLDGEELARRPNSIQVEGYQLKVIAGEGKTRLRMRRATDRVILLGTGPLPCEVQVGNVAPAPAAD